MLRPLVLSAALLYAASASCPSGLTLTRDGLCLTLAETGYRQYFTRIYNDSINICNQYGGATPVIIRNQQDQDYWKSLAHDSEPYLVLGLHCNLATKKWEWADGSQLSYRPAKSTYDLSKPCTSATYAWYIEKTGEWYMATNGGLRFDMDIYCQYSLNNQTQYDDYCDGFVENSDDYSCYQVSKSRANVTQAQRVCSGLGAHLPSVHDSKENAFLRRLAVSNGLSNGLLLGGIVSAATKDHSWVDGSVWNYDNFVPGFPTGLGQCLVMQTSDVNGRWMNADCATELPFACARRPYSSSQCMGAAVKEGDYAYSPGFPGDASTPCDLYFTVDEGKRVEVEIIVLEANSCCDQLVIYEGLFGNDIIATLTGEISGKRFRTKSANSMRVSWQPKGGVNVRGTMVSYRGV